MPRSSAASAVALRRLLVLARDFLQALDLRSVLDLAGKATPELLRADGALLHVVIGEMEYLTEFNSRGGKQTACEDSALLPHSRQAMTDQKLLFITNVVADFKCIDDGSSTIDVATVLAFPFPIIKPIGVLTVFWYGSKRLNRLAKEISTLRHLGELTGAALGNVGFRKSLQGQVVARSEEMVEAARQHADELLRRDGVEEEILRISVTDMMTGLLNRRGFFQRAEQGFELARRQGLPSTIIFVDIDGLKTVNDGFGHDAGDRLIVGTAQILQQSFRYSDVVARLGGDEFAAFALDSGQPHAILARIQQSIDSFCRLAPLSPYRISFCTGIVQCDPFSDLTLADYLSLADRRMYDQKKERGNLRIDPPEVPSPDESASA